MADILPPAPIDAPFTSYNWADWYRKVRDAINSATSINWNAVTNTPTTVEGYGITNGVSIVSNLITFTTAVNDGTGVDIGTLTNAPIAGNPNKWFVVDDNGNTRYIPAW